MDIVVSLALATICFAYQGIDECHPVLLGGKHPTPRGEFVLERMLTDDAGYGGDILTFSETSTTIYAIHRVWMLNPKQKRMERLASPSTTDNFVTGGCINVHPDVYDKLVECCSDGTLTVR